MVILENIDIDIDIDKAILQNIDIDKISNRLEFGISNRATSHSVSMDMTGFVSSQTLTLIFQIRLCSYSLGPLSFN